MARSPWHARLLVLVMAAVVAAQSWFVPPAAWAAEPPSSPAPAAEQPTPSPQPADAAPAAPASTPTPEPIPAPTAVPVVEPAPDTTPAPAVDPADASGALAALPALPAGATELVAERDAYSRAYRTDKGKLVREIYSEPVFYETTPGAGFVPIEAGFAPVAGPDKAVRSDKAPAAVSVAPADDVRGFLAVESDGFRVAYTPLVEGGKPDAAARAAEASVNGSRADLREVFPGVDARVFARAEGANTFLVLAKAPAVTAWTFLVDLPAGATLAANGDGGVDVLDAAGVLRMQVAAPWAVDSTPDEFTGSGRTTTALHYEIGELDGTATLTVSLDDPAWLASAVYPVYVDPTTTVIENNGTDANGDTFANKGNPSMNYANYQRPDSPYYHEMWLGESPSDSTYFNMVYINWATGSLEDLGIDSATVKIRPYHQYYNAPTTTKTWLREVTGTWTESGLTWSEKPAVAGIVDSADCVEGSDCAFDVKALVRAWADDTKTDNGIRLDEIDSSGTWKGPTFWKRLIASEDGTSSKVPRLVVTYHTITTTSTTPSVSPGVSWSYTDETGLAQTRYWVRVFSDAAMTQQVLSTNYVSSTATTWAPAAGALTDLATYWYQVRAGNATGASPWATGSFVYDAQQRGAEPWRTSVPFDLGGGWGLDVAVHNGEARLSRGLYAVPAIGPAHALDLAYSSLNIASAGMLGYGWSSNLTQTLWRDSTTTQVIWYRGDGTRVVFTGSGTTWTPMSGHHETLTVSGTTWTVKEPDQTRLVFSLPSGDTARLARIEDRFGKQLVFTWGATSATVASPGGVTTTLDYPDADGLIKSVTDPAGRTWALGYTGSDLTSLTEPDPDGTCGPLCPLAAPLTTLVYTSHRPVTVSRPRRTAAGGSETLVWTLGYDTGGRLTDITDPEIAAHAGVPNHLDYQPGTTTVDRRQQWTGACTATPSPCNRTTFNLDALGRVTQSTDPLGAVTTYGWNTPASTLAWIDAPVDGSTSIRAAYTYTSAGNVETETADALGDPVTTRYTYNTSNDVTVTETADGTADEVVTTSEYDTAGTGGTWGHLIKVTANSLDPVLDNRQVTEYAYNTDNLVTAEWEHQAFASGASHTGRTTTHAYNGQGVETVTTENCTNTLALQLTDTLVGGVAEWTTCSSAGTKDADTNVTTSTAITGGTVRGWLGLPDSVTMGAGLTNRATAYLYDSLGRTTSETDAAGTTTHEWDELGNEIRTTAPGTLVTTLTLDRMNRVTTEAAPGRTTTTTYDAAGNVVSTTTAGATTSQTFDGLGQLTSETVDPGTAPHLNLTTEHAYDDAGREIATRNPDLTVSRTFYDAQGQVSKTVENCTSSGTTVWAANDDGWKACTGSGTNDATWNLTTTFRYDDRGNKTSQFVRHTGTAGLTTTWTYDDLDRVTKVVDNDVTTPTLPTEDVTTEFAFDAAGNQTAVKSPTAAGGASGYTITRYEYDDLGRVTRTIENCTDSGTTAPGDPAWRTCSGTGTAAAATNVVSTFTYDADGNRLSVTSPNPAAAAGTDTSTTTTRYAYDDAGRLCRVLENATAANPTLTCTSDVTGSTTTANVLTGYGYDTRGNLASMTDANGHQTGYGYDDAGHMTSLTDADGGALAWTYDPLGNRLTQRNRTDPPPTVSVTWTYDAAGRMLTRTADGTVTRYAYDAAGNRTCAGTGADCTTASDRVTAVYDRLGRVVSVDDNADGTADTTYTPGFTAPSWTDPSGTYTSTTDNAGRTTAMTAPSPAGSWSWSYGAGGQVLGGTQGNNNTVTSTFDALGRELTRTTKTGSTTRAAYAWAFNRAGLTLTEASTITGDLSNGTVSYGYDPLGRLASSTLNGATVPYSWDAATNRTGAGSSTTAFDAANRPTSGANPTAAYDSDADGRLIERPGQTMTWDHLGRLTSVTTASGTTTYTYDPLGRLRTVTAAGSTTTLRYRGLSTAIVRSTTTGSAPATRATAAGPDGLPLAEWDPATGAASLRVHGTNAHHDTTWLADSTGAVTSSLRYDPWGVPRSAVPAGYTPFRFQGSWHDATTDLAWVVTRWYAPTMGTFISEDSVLGEPQDPGSRHLYAYGVGDPVGRWDPDGRRQLSLLKVFQWTPYHQAAVLITWWRAYTQSYGARTVYADGFLTLLSGALPGTSGLIRGSLLRPDVVLRMHASNIHYVWEVKKASDYGARSGSNQVGSYVDALRDQGTRARLGFWLPPTLGFHLPDGKLLDVWSPARLPGVVFYQVRTIGNPTPGDPTVRFPTVNLWPAALAVGIGAAAVASGGAGGKPAWVK